MTDRSFKQRVFFALLIFAFLISACGLSEEERQATDTKIAEDIYSTQTAGAPTPANTSTSTNTPGPSPTNTLKPSQKRATSQAEPMVELVQQLYDDGYINSTEGRFFQMDNLNKSWAQINWFRWWTYDIFLNDFVVRTDIAWNTAAKGANIATSGCGFVFWVDEDGERYYVAFLALDGNATLFRMKNDRLIRVGRGYYRKIDYESGSAELMVIAEGEKIQIFVNGEQVFSRDNQTVFSGEIAYTLLSGINTGYGTRCKFTDTQIWSLESSQTE
ncbi:MAG: hypothetical protein PVF83_17350 [Anaerolineales bacterium]